MPPATTEAAWSLPQTGPVSSREYLHLQKNVQGLQLGLRRRSGHTSYTNARARLTSHGLPCKASVCTEIQTQITMKSGPCTLGIVPTEECSVRTNIQGERASGRSKETSGLGREGSRLSIGRRRSSSTCRPHPWSRPGQILHPGMKGTCQAGGEEGYQRELACCRASGSWGTAPSLIPIQPGVGQDLLWLDAPHRQAESVSHWFVGRHPGSSLISHKLIE